MRAGGHFSFFIAKKFQFLRTNLMKAIRKPVKNWMNLSIMKVEAVVSGVIQAVTINCESILPGLIQKLAIFQKHPVYLV